MGSKLSFLLFIQTMMFFTPLDAPNNQPPDEDRHNSNQSDTNSVNFPIDLNLPVLENNPDDDKLERNSDNKNNEEMNLELSLSCGNTTSHPPLSPCSSTLSANEKSHLLASDSSTGSCLISDEVAPLKEVKKDRLIVMGCKRCYLYFMEFESKPMCPWCASRDYLVLGVPKLK